MSGTQYFAVGIIYLALMTASWIAMLDRESEWFEVAIAVSSITFFHGVLYFNYLGVQRRRAIAKRISFKDKPISPFGEWATFASFFATGPVLILILPFLAFSLTKDWSNVLAAAFFGLFLFPMMRSSQTLNSETEE